MAEVAASGHHDEKKLRREKTMNHSSTAAGKVLADEEMARRLHEELNGPELSPAAAAVRRSRKAPTFFTPLLSGEQGAQPEPAAGNEPGKPIASPRGTEAASPRSPFKADADRLEKAGSSAGKKPGAKTKAPVYDSAENSPSARQRPRLKREAKAASAPSPLDTQGMKGRPDADESHSSRQGGRETRLRTKDSAKDFPAYTADDKDSPDRGKAPELTVRVTRSSAAEASGVGDRAVKGAVESEEVPTPKAAASGRLISDSMTNRGSSAGASTRTSSQAGSKGKSKQFPRIPKLPMCLHGDNWYRARKLGENKTKVHLDFPGVVGTGQLWLPKDSSRIWTGSYKGKDWKHLGGGAWEPKVREGSVPKKAGRGRKPRATTEVSDSTSSGGNLSEMDHALSDRATARSEADLATESQPSSRNDESEKLNAMEAEELLVDADEGDSGQAAAAEEEGVQPTSKRPKLETAGNAEHGAVESDGAKARQGSKRPRSVKASDHMDTAEKKPRKRLNGGPKQESSKPLAEELEGVDKGSGKSMSAAPQPHKASEDKAAAKGQDAAGLQPDEASTHEAETPSPGQKHPTEAAADANDLHHKSSGLEELAIAMAGAKGMAQPGGKSEATHPGVAAKSARNRKRAAAKAARAAVEGEAHSPSETDNGKSSSNTPPESPLTKPPASAVAQKTADAVQLQSPAAPSNDEDSWRMCWNEKHMQRLKELEEEEEAAENQDIPEDAPEPYPEQASERPVRAIRAPRLNAIDRSDGNGRGLREADGGSPQSPVRRGTRGKGRWANHVRKGTAGRGAKPLGATASQDTPRAGRGGGRGRRGGRWGSRASKADTSGEDTCLLAFGNLVNALENRLNGVPICYPFQEGQESCPTILQLSPDNFAGRMHQDLTSFRMPPPPVPLFRVAV